VLLLSGEADPFARIELLRAAVPRLRQAELVTYPSVGHGLAPVLDDALDRVVRFIDALPPPEHR
jgi:pimeloyl-ACP methyl ester carboxylesterase